MSVFEIIKFNKKGNYFEQWLKAIDLGPDVWGIARTMTEEKFKEMKPELLMCFQSK